MKTFLNLILGFLILFTSNYQLVAITEDSHSVIAIDTAENSLLSNYVILDNLEDLRLLENHLMVAVKGDYYPIHSLQKIKGRWVAAFNGYCPRMHPLCECGQCHNPTCAYYVKYCSRAK